MNIRNYTFPVWIYLWVWGLLGVGANCPKNYVRTLKSFFIKSFFIFTTWTQILVKSKGIFDHLTTPLRRQTRFEMMSIEIMLSFFAMEWGWRRGRKQRNEWSSWSLEKWEGDRFVVFVERPKHYSFLILLYIFSNDKTPHSP